MKREDRVTMVLTIGQTIDQYQWWRDMIEGGLQSHHKGWSFGSGLKQTAKELVALIKEREDIEIVFLDSLDGRDTLQWDAAAKLIADALIEHKHTPWVILDSKLSHLKPIFTTTGIYVTNQMIESAIFDRWRSQKEGSNIFRTTQF